MIVVREHSLRGETRSIHIKEPMMNSKPIRVIIAVAIATATLGACSTVDRVSNKDFGMYSGTRASAKDGNPLDTAFSAVGDTALLPFTFTGWLFGYRYDDAKPK